MQVELEVNGNRYRVDAPAAEPLSAVLRDRLELTGTKVACGEGTCGSCTVLVDDRPVLSCLTLAAACDGASVRTVEAEGDLLDRLRRAFTEEDGFQCGFCTPGQLMSALALLERTPHPSADEIVTAMSGNLCRCGAYEGIALAVARAAEGTGSGCSGHLGADQDRGGGRGPHGGALDARRGGLDTGVAATSRPEWSASRPPA